jgi:predicted aspartyl protease
MKRALFAFGLALLIIAIASPSLGDKAQNSVTAEPPTALVLPKGVSTVDVPVHIVNGAIIVRVSLNGHALDFAFDSGTSQTYINADVFNSLQLGGETHSKSAKVKLQLGEATLDNVTVYADPLQFQPSPDIKIVGLIGYDLLERAVVRVNYADGILDIMKPDTFVAPPKAVMIPTRTESTVPIVAASIGESSGSQFIVDTGAFAIVVLPHFIDAHPELFNAQSERHDVGETSYVSRLEPVCGTNAVVPYGVPAIRLGAIELPNWLVLAHKNGSCFLSSAKTLDGLLGFDFLRLFVVTFDTPSSRVYFEPRQQDNQ